jgi:ecotin
MIGQTLEVDCNHHRLGGELESKTWKAGAMTTMSLKSERPGLHHDGLPGRQKREEICHCRSRDDAMLRYNSKLPIVYTPENVDVKYRIWRADETIGNAVVRCEQRNA